jgi:pimeloyl-ACP methyl ester carboxylesterase
MDVYSSGLASAFPIIYHHPTPGGRLPNPRTERAVHDAGFRLVSFSRPGYGDSTRAEGRRVADIAADVRWLLEDLEIERAVTWGHSGGGPHALATAALNPDIITGVAVSSCIAPIDAVGLDFFDGMIPDNAAELKLSLTDEPGLRALLQAQADEINQDPLGYFLSESERAGLSPDDTQKWRAALQEGFRTGVDGWVDDMTSLTHRWALDLMAISTPTFIWHGQADQNVPPTHAEWLASRLPDATMHLLAGEGHGLTRIHLPQILADLAATAG